VRWSGFLSAAVIVMLAYSMAAPANASAMSCAAVVVVDGSLLFGVSISHRPGRLPARGASLRAVEPACGDDDDDRRVSVTALADMPVRLAVAPEREDTTLYVADGSMVELGNHPLHGAWYSDASRPSLRRGGSCTKAASLTGTVVHPAGFTRLRLKTADRERTVRVDASSRITNRAAYQPVLPGQQLRLRMVRCGRHRVADRIRFTGATIQPQRYEIERDGDAGALPVLIAAATTSLIGILVIFRLTSR
jgi:hypothetical protein